MIEIAVFALTVLFVVAAAWLHTRWKVRDLSIRHAAEIERVKRELSMQTRPLAFAWWWARNAAESPINDAHRAHFFRFALAALLASDLESLQRDLAALAQRDPPPEGKSATPQAVAAHLASSELTLPLTPWEDWARNPQTMTRPMHNKHAVAECYRAALTSWELLILGSRASSDGSPSNSPASAPVTPPAENS